MRVYGQNERDQGTQEDQISKRWEEQQEITLKQHEEEKEGQIKIICQTFLQRRAPQFQ